MKLRLFIALAALAASPAALPCTSLIAAKGVAKDGSVMITYAADSHTLYGDMPSTPAATHRPGEMRKVYDWDSGKFLC